MPRLHLEITTPERTVWESEVDQVTIPTREGEITVLPNHAPLVGLLAPGALTVKDGGATSYYAISGGALEIMPGNKCVILTDSADRAEELVLEEIEAAKERAVRAVEEARKKNDVGFADASALLERELVRLKVARRHRHSK